ncbi:helix-turn-helix transcriptional regulator [Streptomyces acidiscabies]|uniref:helix-turn-helix transcriptional regulator n=1 Tax=Streptomyces acidiscabies TaxID=42234 RepID=UPI00096406DF|nr:transcriptional activator FtrA [Streptomyces acidiscabies]
MAAPQDTRGIVDPATLLTHVHFRRHLPAPPLRPYIDRYWLIDWDLPTPYTSRVIPHPAVNITFQWDEDGGAPYAELTGIPRGLYTRTLTGRGRVCGVKFRPGAIRAFAPGVAAGWWTGRVLGLDEVAAGGVMRGPGRMAGRGVASGVAPEAGRGATSEAGHAATRGATSEAGHAAVSEPTSKSARETGHEATRGTTSGTTSEARHEAASETTSKAARETGHEATREAMPEATSEARHEAASEAAHGAARKATSEAVREAAVRGAAQPEAVRDAARNPPREALRDPLATLLPALDLTTPGDDETRIAVLDAHFLALPLTPDPQIPLATRLVAQIRETRELRKVSDVADAAGLSPRSLQRLFATHVGVTPKWTILRYRLHEALDQAAHAPDWPALAADLGYADQSHLIRAFTKTVGVPPEAYVQTLR